MAKAKPKYHSPPSPTNSRQKQKNMDKLIQT